MNFIAVRSCLLRSNFRLISNFANNTKKSPAILEVFNRQLCSKPDKKTYRRPEEDGPIKFFGTPASAWQAKQGRSGTVNPDEVPWFQTYVVVGSVAIFLIYFCYLREENDLDMELEKSLFDRIPGLEEQQLMVNYRFNLENNKDNTEIVKRMQELGMNVNNLE